MDGLRKGESREMKLMKVGVMTEEMRIGYEKDGELRKQNGSIQSLIINSPGPSWFG